MAGGDEQGQHGRQGNHGRGAPSDLTQTQRTQIETLLAQTGALAQALRDATDRATLTTRLAEALGADE
ncbi:MAG TPA: hypothetical protein VIC27_05065, partial [Ktedonobacterales bacterium]